jgi:hypothetical protein
LPELDLSEEPELEPLDPLLEPVVLDPVVLEDPPPVLVALAAELSEELDFELPASDAEEEAPLSPDPDEGRLSVL